MTDSKRDRLHHPDFVMERLHHDYSARALALLNNIRSVVTETGEWDTDEPSDMSSDDYKWSFVVWPKDKGYPGSENCVDISIELAEAATYGDDEVFDGFGINWGLDIVEYGGRILGGLTPYNYTDDVWIDGRDDEAVLERWQIIESADIANIAELLNHR